MAAQILLPRGLESALPSSGMAAGEPYWTTDRGSLQVASDATTLLPVVPQIEDLPTLASVSGAADYVMMHDADGTGQKEKKILFNDFKTALNIPASSTDELVAVVSGGTAGYVWGTDGSDGILRLTSALSWVKDAGDGFVTVDIAIVDGGTF